jgi:5-formyltetrahydrofolate cyclo-ligase
MNPAELEILKQKARMRREIRFGFSRLAPSDVARLAARACARLREVEEYRRAGSCLFYAALRDELGVDELIDEALENGRRVYLPLCRPADNEMDVVRISDRRRDLVAGHFGILEPRPGIPLADAAEIEFAVLPGRAFDRDCQRLGRGRAYVDRFLTRMRGRLVSASPAAGIQLVAEVPVTDYDRRVDMVVTESEVIRSDGG